MERTSYVHVGNSEVVCPSLCWVVWHTAALSDNTTSLVGRNRSFHNSFYLYFKSHLMYGGVNETELRRMRYTRTQVDKIKPYISTCPAMSKNSANEL